MSFLDLIPDQLSFLHLICIWLVFGYICIWLDRYILPKYKKPKTTMETHKIGESNEKA